MSEPTKPFTVAEFQERIQAILRPPPAPKVGLVTYACGCSFPTTGASAQMPNKCASCFLLGGNES